MIDFSFPPDCTCHACGGPIHFESLLSVVVCSRCSTKNYPPAGSNTPVAVAKPRFYMNSCAHCGSQTFSPMADGSFLCNACGAKMLPSCHGAVAERKFNCPACGWELPIRGKQPVITCPACGRLNSMPELPDEPDNAVPGFNLDL